jgi:hypothetical protein
VLDTDGQTWPYNPGLISQIVLNRAIAIAEAAGANLSATGPGTWLSRCYPVSRWSVASFRYWHLPLARGAGTGR